MVVVPEEAMTQWKTVYNKVMTPLYFHNYYVTINLGTSLRCIKKKLSFSSFIFRKMVRAGGFLFLFIIIPMKIFNTYRIPNTDKLNRLNIYYPNLLKKGYMQTQMVQTQLAHSN